MVGKDEVLAKVLLAILAGGHILLEDIPGVGKTTLVKALSAVLGRGMVRVQFTPDLLPPISPASILQPEDRGI